MMGNPPTKHQWKQLLNKAFGEHLHTEWHNDINDKPSLKYLALPKHLNKQSHQLWHSVPNNICAVTKANIRAKLITGTYTLQANRAKFNQYSVSSTCILCKSESDDRIHLVLHCTTYTHIRDKHLNTLQLLHSLSRVVVPATLHIICQRSFYKIVVKFRNIKKK